MTVPIDFETVMATIDTSWQAFQKAFEGLSDEQLNDPTAVGYWSCGDLAFHIAYWDEMAGFDAQYRHDNGGAKPPDRDWQAMNDQDYANHKERPASDGFKSMHATHEAMLNELTKLKDDDLSWAIEDLVEHYDEHADDIRKWRAARGI